MLDSKDAKMKSLKEIALDYNVDWSKMPKTVYKCNNGCEDTGWISVFKEENGVTNEYAKICECEHKKRLEQALSVINQGTFQSYDAKTIEQQAIAKRAHVFGSNFGFGGSLMLLGNVGTGKTHLASATARLIIRLQFEKNKVVLVEAPTFSNLISELQKEKARKADHRNKEKSEKIADYQNCDLLILDDFYKKFYNKVFNHAEIEIELFDLINYRYLRSFKCSTIITSELTFEQMEQQDSAIASRLCEMCDDGRNILTFAETKDYRKKDLI